MRRHIYFVSYQGIQEDGGTFFGEGVQTCEKPITSCEQLTAIRQGFIEGLRRESFNVTNCVILNWQLLRIED